MTLSPEFLLKKANFQLSGNSGNHFPNMNGNFLIFFSFPLPYAKIPLLQLFQILQSTELFPILPISTINSGYGINIPSLY